MDKILLTIKQNGEFSQIRTKTKEFQRQWRGGGLLANNELFGVDGSPETYDSNHGDADGHNDSKSRDHLLLYLGLDLLASMVVDLALSNFSLVPHKAKDYLGNNLHQMLQIV
ncbi:hypothetical protein SLEP1_g26988 [Rubroshorea leprosula]|uniref:Uncharacterized protein n=1 Tax=Rubroshorea leprosula TaxID=152421 RepID=A0AAV5K1F7_9ROSI|nr:hypothetical protein SLEP1_g26988 [Rubroshorea leprosula]